MCRCWVWAVNSLTWDLPKLSVKLFMTIISTQCQCGSVKLLNNAWRCWQYSCVSSRWALSGWFSWWWEDLCERDTWVVEAKWRSCLTNWQLQCLQPNNTYTGCAVVKSLPSHYPACPPARLGPPCYPSVWRNLGHAGPHFPAGHYPSTPKVISTNKSQSHKSPPFLDWTKVNQPPGFLLGREVIAWI